MAYGRRNYAPKRRAPKRRARASNSGTTFVSLLKGYALLKLKQKLGLNPETKYVDVAGTTTATSTLQSRIAAPTIAQGNTNQTRNGATVRISKVETRISITAASTAVLPTNVRIIQVRNKRAAQVPVADILQTTTDITSPLQSDYQANGVQILKDITVCVGAKEGNGSQWVEWTHTGLSDHVVWPDSDTAGTPGAAEQGCISTYWMLDGAFDVAPTFAAKSRYWFVDN